jgi:hypothetical protein
MLTKGADLACLQESIQGQYALVVWVVVEGVVAAEQHLLGRG